MKILLLLNFILISAAFSKNESTEQFDKKVKEEVERQIKIIKKKSLAQLTTELLEKERELKKKTNQLTLRREQLKVNEGSLLKKINEFEAIKGKIFGCLDKNKKGAQMRIQQLVDVVSNMKPQKAADLLSVQDSSISIKIIEKIDPPKASKIFNLMDKEVSARLQKQYLNMQR
jgi:flagellar motility protein MotE (MotC chaperone)